MKAVVTAQGNDAAHVEVEAILTALEKERGVGQSLHFTSTLTHPHGASTESFSVQNSTKVTTCLQPGQTKRLLRRAGPLVRRGGRLKLGVYLLGGACSDGKGRWEVGTIHLDWASSTYMPLLSLVPARRVRGPSGSRR